MTIIGIWLKVSNFNFFPYILNCHTSAFNLSIHQWSFLSLSIACDCQGCFAPIVGFTTVDAIHQWSFLSSLHVIAKADLLPLLVSLLLQPLP